MQRDKVFNRKNFSGGTVIFSAGDVARYAFLIEKGRVEIYDDQNGDRHIIGIVGPNELFGEIALIDKGNRSASAQAMEDTQCLVLTDTDFDQILDRADPFLKKLIKLLTKRVRDTNELKLFY